MRRLLLPLVLFLVLAGSFGWWWYQPERVIARRITSLLESAAVEETTSDIARTTRGSAIEGYLAPNVTIHGTDETNEYVEGPQSRDSLVASYTAAARGSRRISFEAPVVEELTLSGDVARAKVSVDTIIELQNGERPVDGMLRLDMEWKKIEKQWVLSSVSGKETAR